MSVLDHLFPHLPLKFLSLTAEFIKLFEHCLKFFRRNAGHKTNQCNLR